MPTADTVRQLAMAVPGVTERTCYGTPAFYVRKKIFARLLEDADTVVIKINFEHREVLMNAAPQSFFITDHYRNYPMVIVRLSSITRSDLKELLDEARQFAAS